MQLQTSDNSQVLVLTLAALVMAIGIALGIVWMRQQIFKSAQCTQVLEEQFENLQRQASYLASKIAALQSPESLKLKAKGLVPPAEKQIVWAQPTRSTYSPIASNKGMEKPHTLMAYSSIRTLRMHSSE